jgi:hypothetical protein
MTQRAMLLDSANQKPPFAAEAAALLADPSWEGQFQMVREGGSALSATGSNGLEIRVMIVASSTYPARTKSLTGSTIGHALYALGANHG